MLRRNAAYLTFILMGMTACQFDSVSKTATFGKSATITSSSTSPASAPLPGVSPGSATPSTAPSPNSSLSLPSMGPAICVGTQNYSSGGVITNTPLNGTISDGLPDQTMSLLLSSCQAYFTSQQQSCVQQHGSSCETYGFIWPNTTMFNIFNGTSLTSQSYPLPASASCQYTLYFSAPLNVYNSETVYVADTNNNSLIQDCENYIQYDLAERVIDYPNNPAPQLTGKEYVNLQSGSVLLHYP